MVSPSIIWLQERTALGVLSQKYCMALLKLEEQVVPANYRLVLEDTPLEALYVLKQGH